MGNRARTAVILAGLLAAGYVGVCAIMVFNQASFVYFPERTYSASPREYGLPFEEVRLEASDGTVLAAWWIPSEGARGAVVLAHGNGGNMSHRPAGG